MVMGLCDAIADVVSQMIGLIDVRRRNDGFGGSGGDRFSTIFCDSI